MEPDDDLKRIILPGTFDGEVFVHRRSGTVRIMHRQYKIELMDLDSEQLRAIADAIDDRHSVD